MRLKSWPPGLNALGAEVEHLVGRVAACAPLDVRRSPSAARRSRSDAGGAAPGRRVEHSYSRHSCGPLRSGAASAVGRNHARRTAVGRAPRSAPGHRPRSTASRCRSGTDPACHGLAACARRGPCREVAGDLVVHEARVGARRGVDALPAAPGRDRVVRRHVDQVAVRRALLEHHLVLVRLRVVAAAQRAALVEDLLLDAIEGAGEDTRGIAPGRRRVARSFSLSVSFVTFPVSNVDSVVIEGFLRACRRRRGTDRRPDVKRCRRACTCPGRSFGFRCSDLAARIRCCSAWKSVSNFGSPLSSAWSTTIELTPFSVQRRIEGAVGAHRRPRTRTRRSPCRRGRRSDRRRCSDLLRLGGRAIHVCIEDEQAVGAGATSPAHDGGVRRDGQGSEQREQGERASGRAGHGSACRARHGPRAASGYLRCRVASSSKKVAAGASTRRG